MTHYGQHSGDGGTSTDTTGSGGTTVGFRYFMGMHMALCRGPVDEIIEIRVGDRTAWAASVLANITIPVDAYDLFGGEASEGGIKGDLTFMFGGADQTCPDNLSLMLDSIASNAGGSSSEQIAIDSQTIEGYAGDTYVGIKTDDLGYAYSTHSSGPDIKLGRPWNLKAPLYDPSKPHAPSATSYFGSAHLYNIRFHLETGGTIPFVDGLGMAQDKYYTMGTTREFRLVAPGTATFLITIEATSGAVLSSTAVVLHLPG